MKTFSNIFKADLYKLKYAKWTWILPIVYFALMLISYGLIYYILRIGMDLDEPMAEEFIAISAKDSLITSPNSSNFVLGFVIVTTIFICKEFKSGFTKLRISRGNNKTELYLSKLVILAGVTIVYTIGLYVLSAILNLAFFGIQSWSATEIANIFRSCALSCLVNVANVALGIMIAYLIRNLGGAIAVNIGIILTETLLVTIAAFIEGDHPLKYAMYGLPANLVSLAGNLDTYDTTILVELIVVPIFVITACSVISALTFKARDVK